MIATDDACARVRRRKDDARRSRDGKENVPDLKSDAQFLHSHFLYQAVSP